MLPRFWVASTERCKDAGSADMSTYRCDRGRRSATRDRGPEAGKYCWAGHRARSYPRLTEGRAVELAGAVQDGDPPPGRPPEEREQEAGHALLIGRIWTELEPDRGSDAKGFLDLGSGRRVSPIWSGRSRRPPAPPVGVLRRQRRALLDEREERLRDLGGLLLEMFRRDRFREDLVEERCRALLLLEDRLTAIDAMLGLTRPGFEPERCTCGAALSRSARFCAACGRSIGDGTPEASEESPSAPEIAS